MSEAAEFRAKQNRLTYISGIGGLLAALGWVALVAGASIPSGRGAGLGIAGVSVHVLGLVLASNSVAAQKDGFCRRVWSKITTFEDRPLNEWKEDIEARGKFHGGPE